MEIAITPDRIWLNMLANNRGELIHAICQRLAEQTLTNDVEGLYHDVLAREQLVSTFAGHGCAIPHVVTPHISEPVMVFARTVTHSLPWQDASEPVRFVFFCAVPNSQDKAKYSQWFATIAQWIHQSQIVRSLNEETDASAICQQLNASLSMQTTHN